MMRSKTLLNFKDLMLNVFMDADALFEVGVLWKFDCHVLFFTIIILGFGFSLGIFEKQD